nr:protein RALF-like 27 [Ipomoea batatas]
MARFCHNNIGTLLPLLITLFIATSVPVAQSLSTHSTSSGRKCGGAAECGGEEFLMDSQTATWLLSSLQGNTQNTISYKGLKRPPVCDAKRSGSCLADKVNGGNSKCDYHNRSCVR